MARGDVYPIMVNDAASGSSENSVRLRKGFYNKAYWDDVSYLATHRRAGLRSDVELNFVSAVGARNDSGGAEDAEIEYAVESSTAGFNGSTGYVGRGGFGGGVFARYASKNVTVSADVDTAATATTDTVSDKWTEAVTDVTPYLAYLWRPKTGDLGFGAGLGVLIRNREVKVELEDAEQTSDLDPATSQLVGPALEFIVNSNSWATILQLTPGISGEEKQGDADPIERSSSEYGFHVETYGQKFKTRIGLVFLTDKGTTDNFEQKDSGFRFSTRLDFDMRSYHLVPFIDYESLTREIDTAEGKRSALTIGTRVAWSGVYAPFFSLAVATEDQTQSGDTFRIQKLLLAAYSLPVASAYRGKDMRRLLVPMTIISLMAIGPLGCFEKGDGSGSRATRGDFNDKGDVFLPGPDGKPGGEKDPEGKDPTKDPAMDPVAVASLAECFNIPDGEVQPVVGWTGDAAQDAATALCADLETVKYGGGTIINDADAVAFEETAEEE